MYGWLRTRFRKLAHCRVSERALVAELGAYRAIHGATAHARAVPPWSRRRIVLLLWTMPMHLLLRRIANWLRLTPGRWPAEWLAAARVHLDCLHPFRCASPLHEALTDLGLGVLRRGDLQLAIDCLVSSWHVHPDPRLLSYGLRPELADALAEIPAAQSACAEYDMIARLFSPQHPLDRGSGR